MAFCSYSDFTAMLALAGTTANAALATWFTAWQPAVEGKIIEFLGYDPTYATGNIEYLPSDGFNRFLDAGDGGAGIDVIGGLVVRNTRPVIARNAIRLTKLPVRSVEEVIDNPGAWNTTAGGSWTVGLVPAASYYLDCDKPGFSWSGQLFRSNGSWGVNRRSIRVTYTAGLQSGSEMNTHWPHLKLAAVKAMMAVYMREVTKAAAVLGINAGTSAGQIGTAQSVSIRDFSVSFNTQLLASMISGAGQSGTAADDGFALPAEVTELLQLKANYSAYL